MFLERTIAKQLMARADNAPASARQVEQRARIRECQRKRLLGVHVRAAVERRMAASKCEAGGVHTCTTSGRASAISESIEGKMGGSCDFGELAGPGGTRSAVHADANCVVVRRSFR